MRASNMSLCDIMAKLWQTYGVVASSENQYKRKLATWGLLRRYKSASRPCVDSGQNPSGPGLVEDETTSPGKNVVLDHEQLSPEAVYITSDPEARHSHLRRKLNLFFNVWTQDQRSHMDWFHTWLLDVTWSWRPAITSSTALVPRISRPLRSPDEFRTDDLHMEEIRKFGPMPSYSLDLGSMSDLLTTIKGLRSSKWAWKQNLNLSCAFGLGLSADPSAFLDGLLYEREDILWVLPYLSELEQRHVILILDDSTLVECLLLWLSSPVRYSAELIGRPILQVILPWEEESSDELMTAHWVLDKLSPKYQDMVRHSTRAQGLPRPRPYVTEEAANMIPYCDAVGYQPSKWAIFGGAQGSLSHSLDTPSFSHTEQICCLMQNGLSSELRPLRRWFISQYNKVVDSCSGTLPLRNDYWREKKHPKYPSRQHLRKPRRFQDLEWESSAWDGAISSLHALAQVPLPSTFMMRSF